MGRAVVGNGRLYRQRNLDVSLGSALSGRS